MGTTADIGQIRMSKTKDALIYEATLYVRDAQGYVIAELEGKTKQPSADIDADEKAAQALTAQAVGLKTAIDNEIALNTAHAGVRDRVKILLAGGS